MSVCVCFSSVVCYSAHRRSPGVGGTVTQTGRLTHLRYWCSSGQGSACGPGFRVMVRTRISMPLSLFVLPLPPGECTCRGETHFIEQVHFPQPLTSQAALAAFALAFSAALRACCSKSVVDGGSSKLLWGRTHGELGFMCCACEISAAFGQGGSWQDRRSIKRVGQTPPFVAARSTCRERNCVPVLVAPFELLHATLGELAVLTLHVVKAPQCESWQGQIPLPTHAASAPHGKTLQNLCNKSKRPISYTELGAGEISLRLPLVEQARARKSA
jgi:hypothetical protein